MASLNKVFLMGNLTRDPELRYTPSGTAICEFGLAINRRFLAKDGQQQEETCFVDLTMWGKRGTVVSEYLHKGDPIFVEGRLQYDSWEGQDGRRRNKLKVVVDNFEFIGGRRGEGGGSRAEGGGREPRPQQPPSERQAPPEQQPAEEGFDVSDDEIPF
jgi:single-strand DNA-binding protein